MEYLNFELPIKELMDQYQTCSLVGEESGVDVKLACSQIEDKIIEKKKEIYSNLTPWQRVQLSRHPDRPYTLDFIKGIVDKDSFLELHGDRNFADDPAMIGGLATLDGQRVMIIGTQKGRTTKERQHRRFGMSNPEGYRKALRLMKLAEKFKIPVISLIDTPGAYPGLEAEERGQGEAIARNIGQVNKVGGNLQWLKPKLSIADHLDYKFILSLEGNDVATNLKWIMSSNSLAVSPPLKIETWFMEGTLKPDEHFVGLGEDYKNLEEKLNYYLEHEKEAKEIVTNAQHFRSQFNNRNVEDLTAMLVLKKYFNYIH